MTQSLQESNKVKLAVIRVTSHLSIDGYQFPCGEIRYSVEGVCELFDLDLMGLKSRSGTQWQQLIDCGFKGEVVEGALPRSGDAPLLIPTLSRSDVLAIGVFAAGQLQRLKARALMIASFAEILEGCTRVAFGLPAMTIDERLSLFESESDHASISDARAILDDMTTDDRVTAPLDSSWSIRGISGPFLVHENPWD
jgi:hypothetical protein